MINIFNLFLFLISIWILVMIITSKSSAIYFLFGSLAAILISFFSYKLKIIDKKSKFLYLNIGFYRHFFALFVKNYVKSLILILKFAFFKNDNLAIIKKYKIHNQDIDITMLVSSINMITGLYAINKGNELIVYYLDKSYLKDLNFKKIYKSLNNIDDNNLV